MMMPVAPITLAPAAKLPSTPLDLTDNTIPLYGNMKVRGERKKSKPPLGEAQLVAVAGLFAVLAEPTRLRILQFLQAGPATVTKIVERLGMKQANVSKQLGVLHQAGVVGREKQGLSVRYSIRMPIVFDLCDLVCGRLLEEAEARARALSAGEGVSF